MSVPSEREIERRLAELGELCRLGSSLLAAEVPPLGRELLCARSLEIQGLASPSVQRGLSLPADPRDVVLWAAPARGVHHVGWIASACVDAETGEVLGAVPAVLVAVSNATGARRDVIARGEQAIVTVRFPLARPSCLDELPVLDRSSGSTRLLLCAERDRVRTHWGEPLIADRG